MNIAIYWLHHHHLTRAIFRVTPSILWANLVFLFFLSLFSFATAWRAEHGFAPNTVAGYAIVCVRAALGYTALQTVIVASHGTDSRLGVALGRDLRAKLSLGTYVLS